MTPASQLTIIGAASLLASIVLNVVSNAIAREFQYVPASWPTVLYSVLSTVIQALAVIGAVLVAAAIALRIVRLDRPGPDAN